MTGEKGKRGGSRPGAGRKPLPTEVKRIKGTLQKSRTRPEPQPEGTLSEPPAYMSETAKEAWHYALQHAPVGLLTSNSLRINFGFKFFAVQSENG